MITKIKNITFDESYSTGFTLETIVQICLTFHWQLQEYQDDQYKSHPVTLINWQLQEYKDDQYKSHHVTLVHWQLQEYQDDQYKSHLVTLVHWQLQEYQYDQYPVTDKKIEF